MNMMNMSSHVLWNSKLGRKKILRIDGESGLLPKFKKKKKKKNLAQCSYFETI